VPGYTPNQQYPYPLVGEPPAGHTQMAELATAIDLDVAGIVPWTQDTGFRNITSLLINGWTATTVIVRRIGGTVHLAAQDLTCPATYNMDAAGPAADGFKFIATPYAHGLIYASPYNMHATISGLTSVWIRVLTVVTSGQKVRFMYSYPTVDAWPSTLPGVPMLLDELLDQDQNPEQRPEDAR